MIYHDIMLCRYPATELGNLTTSDLNTIGEMDYLLAHCFPSGDIPQDFGKYVRLIGIVKNMYGDIYDSLLERKLQEDKKIIEKVRKGEDILEVENPVYARSLIWIVESEEVKRDKSKILVLYQGDQLYEENVREGVFDGLPEGSVVAFDYSPQGLMLNLETTIAQSPKAKDRVEQVVIEGLASDVETKRYIDVLYDQINEEFNA
jgi:hypothetical protein